MDYSGTCGLIIKGETLDFIDIERELQLGPTRVYKKGEIVSKIIGANEFDIWIFEIAFHDGKQPFQALDEILSLLKPSKDYLRSLAHLADLTIKCYVQSDYSQIDFDFYPNQIKELSSMNIRLKLSILSWGGAKQD